MLRGLSQMLLDQAEDEGETDMSQKNDYFPCYDEDDPPEQECCDYTGEECVGDKLFCEECWLFQELDQDVTAKVLHTPNWDVRYLSALFEERAGKG